MRTSRSSLLRPSLTDALYRVEQQRRALLAETLLPRDLNLAQWIALGALARKGASTMTELAQSCAVDRTSLTRTIDNLVQRGLVARSTPARDRRTVLVETSAEGLRLARILLAEIKTLEDQWLGIFDADEHDRLVDDLERLRARLGPSDRRVADGRVADGG